MVGAVGRGSGGVRLIVIGGVQRDVVRVPPSSRGWSVQLGSGSLQATASAVVTIAVSTAVENC